MKVELNSADIVGICMALRKEIRNWAPGTLVNTAMTATLEKLQDINLNVPEAATKDDGPHSRACGPLCPGHGPSCHSNCPTCGGKDV